MADLYPNLPGFSVDIRDGGLKVVAPAPLLTQKVLILGTATDGPKNVPVNIRGIQSVETTFGSLANIQMQNLDTCLQRGIFEAYNAGCNNITVCRITGSEATLPLTSSAVTKVTLKTLYAGSRYNDVSALVETSGTNKLLKITRLDGTIITYTVPSTASYNDVVNAVNQNSNRDNVIAITADPNTVQNLDNMVATDFSGGTDGVPSDYATTALFKEAYQDALAASLALLEGYATDFIVVMGATIDPDDGDSYKFAQNLAQYCYRSMAQDADVLTVISMAPLYNPDLANIAGRVTSLSELSLIFTVKNDYITTTSAASADDDVLIDGAAVDIGRYLSILVGPDPLFYHSRIGRYTATAEAVYSGLAARLPVQSAPTNKVLGGVLGLTYTLSNGQHNTLSGLKFVTLKNKDAGTSVVNAVTYAPDESDFARLSTNRIVNAALDVIRAVCNPYLGEGDSPAVRNAMSTAIQNGLENLKGIGVIQDFRFQISGSLADSIAGHIPIDLELVPAFEIRKVTVRLMLKAKI